MTLLIILMVVSFVNVTQSSLISPYDRARLAFDRGDFSQAQQHLDTKLIEDPFDGQALYDAGVVAHKQKQLSQAVNYFKQAREKAQKPSELEQKALFNQATAHAQLKQLQESIDVYQQMLEIYPDDERARHNLEIVKKMLEEQQRNEQQQQEQKKNQQESSNQQDQNNSDTQQESSDDKKREEPNEKGQDDNKKNGQQKDSDNEDQSNHQEDEGVKKNDGGNTQNQENESGQRTKESEHNQEQSQTNGADSEHNASQDEGDQSNQANDHEVSGQEKESPLKKIDSALASFIEEHDKHDAALNKQFIQIMVGQQKKRNHDAPEW